MPAGLRKSAPLWALLRLAVEDAARTEGAVGWLRHGADEAAVHSFCGAASLQQRAISAASSAMRFCALAGGLTNASSTLSVRVGKFFAVTISSCVSRSTRPWKAGLERDRVFPRLHIQVNAHQDGPGPRIDPVRQQRPIEGPRPKRPDFGRPWSPSATTSSPGWTDREVAVTVNPTGGAA